MIPKAPFRRNITLVLSCLLGGMFIPYLSIQLNPSPKSQNLTISYNYPDAGPEVVEQEVTSRLESVFATLRGLQEIKSTSDDGAGRISLTFNRDIDMEKKRMEIAMLIRQIYPRLHQVVSYPQIAFQSEFEEFKSLLVYNLSSDQPANQLEQLVNEQIMAPLSLYEGVHKIELHGLQTEAYQVIVDDRLRKRLAVADGEIQKAIRQQLSQRELGLAEVQVDEDQNLLAVRYGHKTNGALPEELLLNIPLTERSGRIIILSDIAEVRKAAVKPNYHFRINGQTAVTLVIYAAQNTNQIRLAGMLKKKIKTLQTGLEKAVRFDLVRDETEFLSLELQNIGLRAGITLLLLLLFMIVVRPNWHYLLVIWLSLAASLLIAVNFYYLLGLELHLYSIAGWTLSIGIVLDNLIVMTDHIRHHDNQRIFPAIFSATLTTIGAVSVVFFIEDQYRESLSDFSWVFMVNLLVSLLVALIFIPALYKSLFPKEERCRFSIKRKKRVLHFTKIFRKYVLFSCRFRPLFIMLLILSFGLPLFLLPSKWEQDHFLARWYNQTLGSDLYQRSIRSSVDKYLGGTLKLFYGKKEEFYFQQQKQEETTLYLRAKMPFGGTLEQLNEVIQTVEAYLSRYEEVDKFQSRISSPDQSSIAITFKPEYEKGAFPYTLKSRLENLAVKTGNADFSVYGVGRGFDNEVRGANLSFQIQLLGYNYEELWRLAFRVRGKLLDHRRIQKAFINAEPSYFEPREEYFQIRLPEMVDLQQNQLSPGRIGSLLKGINVEQGTAGFIQAQGNHYPIQIFAADEGRNQLWNLRSDPHVLDSNQVYKHGQYLGLSKEKGQQKIIRVNQQYQLIVAYDFIGDRRLGTQVMEQKLDTLSRQIPIGYSIRQLDQSRLWDGGSGQRQLLQVLFAAILAIFMINAILFNSLRQAFIPLLLIFPAYIGVFLCVFLFDFSFDQGGFASFLLVAGLSVNAALFIINDYNNYKRSRPQLSDLDIFLKAFNAKIIPIILTTLSTILGLLPFILFDAHQTFWYSLAICTIGGLVFSTLAVYLFFPMFLLHGKRSAAETVGFFPSKVDGQ